MPSSPNRRRIEIPDDLHQQLVSRAGADGTTVAALAARLLREALNEASVTDELRRQRGMLKDVLRHVSAIHERIDTLHPIAPGTTPMRAAAGPISMQPDVLERARKEIIDELRRNRHRHDAGEGEQP